MWLKHEPLTHLVSDLQRPKKFRSEITYILGDPGADSGDEGKSKRAGKCGTKKSKERREEPFFTFLRSIYIFPPV